LGAIARQAHSATREVVKRQSGAMAKKCRTAELVPGFVTAAGFAIETEAKLLQVRPPWTGM